MLLTRPDGRRSARRVIQPSSSSGPGRRPFKAVARVRIPLGAHTSASSRRPCALAVRPVTGGAAFCVSGPRPVPSLAQARRSRVRGSTPGLIRWSSEIGPPARVRPVTENHRPEAPYPAIRPSRSAAESRWEHARTCGRLSLARSAEQGPVEQFGVLATLSRWRPRVQIPSGPRWLGSSVGTSDRLKSDRSPVRPRPQPPAPIRARAPLHDLWRGALSCPLRQ